MSHPPKRHPLGRKTLCFLCCLLAAPLATRLIPGISADSIYTALIAGAALGVAYLLIRPILRLLTLPIGCLTLGLFGWVIDTALILALPFVRAGFEVSGVIPAFLVALLVNVLCMIVDH